MPFGANDSKATYCCSSSSITHLVDCCISSEHHVSNPCDTTHAETKITSAMTQCATAAKNAASHDLKTKPHVETRRLLNKYAKQRHSRA